MKRVLSNIAMTLVVLFAPHAMAQDTTAGITGKVTDPSAAPIPNATVTAKDVDRGTIWKTQTNSEGAYNLPLLPIGKSLIEGIVLPMKQKAWPSRLWKFFRRKILGTTQIA